MLDRVSCLTGARSPFPGQPRGRSCNGDFAQVGDTPFFAKNRAVLQKKITNEKPKFPGYLSSDAHSLLKVRVRIGGGSCLCPALSSRRPRYPPQSFVVGVWAMMRRRLSAPHPLLPCSVGRTPL